MQFHMLCKERICNQHRCRNPRPEGSLQLVLQPVHHFASLMEMTRKCRRAAETSLGLSGAVISWAEYLW